jgi:hypothetical protein
MGNEWSPIEDTFLIENAHRMSYEELSLYLAKSENSIRQRSILLDCTSSVSPTKNVHKICAYSECRRVFKVRSSDYIKRGTIFCSTQCEDFYGALFYPGKAEIEYQISNGKTFTEVAEKFRMPEGALYELYLRYMIPGRSDEVQKVFFLKENKDQKEKRKTLLKQTGRSPMNKFRGGYKPHLGVSVRSGWENNVLLWLNHQGVQWKYEPEVFYFNDVKRGTKGYTPDIWLTKEKVWIEVKGYMSSVDKTKIKRFKKYYPEEFKKLQAITKNDKVDSTKFFKDFGVPIFAYYDDIDKEFSELDNWMR